MALDRFFCPIKSNKSNRKTNAAIHHQATRQETDSIQPQMDAPNYRTEHRTPPNNSVTQFNNTPYRYVKHDFEAVQHDEVSVNAGDIVLYEFSDFLDGKKWSHVTCIGKVGTGFVPSEILTTEKRSSQSVKKKLPRSMGDPSPVDHPHAPTRTQCTSDKTCPSNGGSIKLQHHQNHQHLNNHPMKAEWMQQFPMPPNSFQDSAGFQTFQKYPVFSTLSPPAYYNLDQTSGGAVPPPLPIQYGRFCRPFPILYCDQYMVMHNFVAREEGDLNVQPGEVVSVLNKDDDNWYWVRRNEDRGEGFVPARFIVPYEQVQSVLEKGNSTVTMKSSNHIQHTYMNHRPDRESLQTDQQSSLFPT